MHAEGSKMKFVYDHLSAMKSGEVISVHFENDLSDPLVMGYKEECRLSDIPPEYRMNRNMFRSYAAKIAIAHNMNIKTKNGPMGKFLYIWKVC